MKVAERILILDDDPDIRKTLTDILEHKGYFPFATARAQEALEAAARGEIAVALIDLRLEDMPGIEVLRRIKAVAPETECIILTGYASQEVAIEAINVGAFSFLQKPYHIPQLLVILQRALEKRAAARALAESHALYRTFLDATQDMASLKDENFRYLLCNQAKAAFFGRPIEEIIGRDDFELIDPQIAETCRHTDRQVLEEGRALTTIEVIGERVYEAYKFPVPLPGGRTGIGSYVREITERLRAEEQMRLQSTALQSSANAIVIADRNGIIKWANPAFTRLTGYQVPDEVFGRSPRDLVKSGKQDRAFYENLWNTILSGQVWHGTLINRRKDGTLYDEEMTITPVKDASGQITHFIAIKQDISERKRYEEKILENERRYATLIETSPAGIFRTDAAGLTTYVSPRWCEIAGLEAESALGDGWLQAVHPEDREKLAAHWRQDSASGRISTAEYRFLHADGTIRWVRGQAVPERDAQGQVVGYVGAILDVTEAKQIESALRISEARYRGLFEESPISLWEEDFSEVKKRLDALRHQGVQDFRAYFKEHPEFVRECARLVRVLDVNRATLRLYRANAKEDLLQNLTTVFQDESYQEFCEELICIAEGKTLFSWEGSNRTLDGQRIDISLSWAVVPGHEHDLSRVIISIVDITERKRAEAETKRLLEQLMALNRAGEAVNASLDLRSTLNEIISIARQVSGAEYASILLLDNSGNLQESVENLPDVPELKGRARRVGLTRWIIRNRQPAVVESADSHGRIYPQLPGMPRTINPFLRKQGIRSLAGLPLLVEEQVVGLLYLYSRQPNAFAGQLPLLTAFAHQAAIAIRKARLYNALQQELEERIRAEAEIRRYLADLEMLYHSSAGLNRSLDPRQIAQFLVETLRKYLNWHHIAIRLRRGESREFELMAFHQAGMRPDEYEEIRQRFASQISTIDQGLSGLAVRRGETIIVENVHDFPEYVETYHAIQSGLYVPLKIESKVIGVIAVESETPAAFSERDARLLETLAAQAAAAFENARLYQDTVQSAQRREVLYRLSQEISQKIGDLEAVYEAIYHAAQQLMPADNFTIALHDERTAEFTGEYLIDEGKRYPPVRASIQQGISGYVIRKGAPLRIGDIFREKDIPQPVHFGTEKPSRAYLCVPLRMGERIIGAMSVQSYQSDVYTEEDEVILEMLAAYAAPAIENARLYTKTRKQLQELITIHEFSQRLLRLQTPEELAEGVAQLLESLLQYEHSSVLLINKTTKTLFPFAVSAIGKDKEFIARLRAHLASLEMHLGEGITGWVALHGQSVRLDDVRKDTRYYAARENILSELCVPMKIGDEIIGVINVESPRLAAYTEDDQRLLEIIAAQISIAIQNARLLEETRRHVYELEEMVSLSSELRLTSEVNEILPVIAKHALRSIAADVASCYLLDVDNHRWVLQGWQSADGKWQTPPFPVFHPRGEGVTDLVGSRNRLYITGDWRTDPFNKPLSAEIDWLQEVTSCISLPLASDQRVLGVLHVWYRDFHAFSQEEKRLLTAIADIGGNALQRAFLFEETRRRVEQLQALQVINQAILSSVDLRLCYHILMEQTRTQLHVDAVSFLLYQPQEKTFACVSGEGFRHLLEERPPVRLGMDIAGQAALERKTIIVPDLTEADISAPMRSWLEKEGFLSYSATPLISKGQLKGVLEVFHRAPLSPTREWINFFETLARQAAIAIDNAQLFDELQRANFELALAYDATIEGLSRALDLRDQETEGHTRRVADLSVELARALGMSEEEIVHLRRGALLHDIGKIGIPDAILFKAGPLNKKEWEIMRRHPQAAYEMLAPIEYLRPALDIPHYHHEHWDGSGYPEGLKGEEIPLAARIFAVVDVWDALTSDRPYRKAWSRAKALDYIREQSGKLFDPRIVEVFLKIMSEK